MRPEAKLASTRRQPRRRAAGTNRRLLLLACGVVVSHTTVTVLEERLFSLPSFRKSAGGAYMTLFMYTLTVLAYFPRVMRSREGLGFNGITTLAHGQFQHRHLALVALLYVGTTTLTKTSLRYVDVPTQTVLKSSKLLPVMAGSIIILRKSYSNAEWLAALMLCSGIAVFNLSTHFPELRQTAAGASCISVALVCDALLGNVQQKVLAQGITIDALMLVQSATGAMAMLVVTYFDRTLLPGTLLLLDDVSVAATLLLWALSIICGTAIILQVVAEYSAVTAIVVTTCRKALSLIASFVLFPKHLGIGHPIGAALVFGSAFVARNGATRRARPQPAEPAPLPLNLLHSASDTTTVMKGPVNVGASFASPV